MLNGGLSLGFIRRIVEHIFYFCLKISKENLWNSVFFVESKIDFTNYKNKITLLCCLTHEQKSNKNWRKNMSAKRYSTHFIIYLFHLIIWMKTPSFKYGEYEENYECDECFFPLRDVVLFLFKDDLFFRKFH